MYDEIICDSCGKIIPGGTDHIESNGLNFCNDDCEWDFNYMIYEDESY